MKTEKELENRFKILLDTLSLTPNAFAKELGYSRSEKIYNFYNGKYNPSFEVLYDITKKFEGVNLNWLVGGQGNMFLTNDESKYLRSDNELIETQRELIIQLKARISSLEEKLNQSTSEIKKTILGD